MRCVSNKWVIPSNSCWQKPGIFINPHLDTDQGAGVLSNENIYSSVNLYY